MKRIICNLLRKTISDNKNQPLKFITSELLSCLNSCLNQYKREFLTILTPPFKSSTEVVHPIRLEVKKKFHHIDNTFYYTYCSYLITDMSREPHWMGKQKEEDRSSTWHIEKGLSLINFDLDKWKTSSYASSSYTQEKPRLWSRN